MNEQRRKIEIEALRFLFKHKGEEIPDEVLEALVTWPENTEINRAVKTVINVVIALEIATAMRKIIEEVKILPKFPSGGIISGRGVGGEHIIHPDEIRPKCEQIRLFPWADAPTIQFEAKEEIHPILFKPKYYLFQNNIAGFINFCDHGKEGTEEDISLQGEEEKRAGGSDHVCDMDKPPE